MEQKTKKPPPKPKNDPKFNFLRFFTDSRPPPESHTHHHHHNDNTTGSLDSRPTTMSASPLLGHQAVAEEERNRQQQDMEKIVVWIPELTLTVSLDDLSRAIDVTTVSHPTAGTKTAGTRPSNAYNKIIIDDRVPVSLVKRTKKVPRLVRYKELLKRTNYVLGYYRNAGMDRKMEKLTFRSFCYECGRSSGVTLEECIGCGMICYCGRKCRIESWKKGHGEECKMFKSKAGITCVKSKTSKDNNWHRAMSSAV